MKSIKHKKADNLDNNQRRSISAINVLDRKLIIKSQCGQKSRDTTFDNHCKDTTNTELSTYVGKQKEENTVVGKTPVVSDYQNVQVSNEDHYSGVMFYESIMRDALSNQPNRAVKSQRNSGSCPKIKNRKNLTKREIECSFQQSNGCIERQIKQTCESNAIKTIKKPTPVSSMHAIGYNSSAFDSVSFKLRKTKYEQRGTACDVGLTKQKGVESIINENIPSNSKESLKCKDSSQTIGQDTEFKTFKAELLELFQNNSDGNENREKVYSQKDNASKDLLNIQSCQSLSNEANRISDANIIGMVTMFNNASEEVKLGVFSIVVSLAHTFNILNL